MKWLLIAAWSLLSLAVSADPVSEQLIVFVQPGASALAQAFEREDLPKLKALAHEMGLDFQVVDVTGGAPRDISLTPMIVYQNHLGRSIYQGRYTTLDRLRRHVGTSRVMAPSDRQWKRPDTMVRTVERARIAMPIKVTPLRGTLPQGFDQATFEARGRDAIAQGAVDFDRQAAIALTQSDRMFYADFYPYLAEDGTLSVATALFSQFHCHRPVFTQNDPPVVGPWAQRDAVFAQAGAALAQQIAVQMQSSSLGDGFDPVASSVPTKTYEQLGLPLPQAPASRAYVAGSNHLALGPHWQVIDDTTPAIGFRFPSPLEMYAGEATDLTGKMDFDASLDIASAQGVFIVAADSVTMGESDLDAQIHSRAMLDVAKYPTSRFTFDPRQAQGGPLSFGQVMPVTLVGSFEMMGQSIPLAVRGQLEAFVIPLGQGEVQRRLLFTATWRLPILEPFGLQGPDGPDKAKNHLVFNAHILFKPRFEDESAR